MNFKELQDEVIALRFNSALRTSVKSWLNLRYQWLWNHADWTFRTVSQAAFPMTAGSRTPLMPAEFGKALDVYDSVARNPLIYVDRQTFEYDYLSTPSAAVGLPSVYTVIDRQIYVDPIPGSALAYKLSYERRLAHIDASTGITGGIMVEDTDQPLWSAEHDYVLVVEAMILGQQLQGDPTWQILVPQRDELLQAMVADLVVQQTGELELWGEP